jgi:hypothetical protein
VRARVLGSALPAGAALRTSRRDAKVRMRASRVGRPMLVTALCAAAKPAPRLNNCGRDSGHQEHHSPSTSVATDARG